MPTVDFSTFVDSSQTPSWRHQALRLAFEKHLDGQASPARGEVNPACPTYLCVSANEPTDHTVMYDPKTGSVHCDCVAGEYRRPCSHAGAVLLLIANLVEARSRNAQGKSQV